MKSEKKKKTKKEKKRKHERHKSKTHTPPKKIWNRLHKQWLTIYSYLCHDLPSKFIPKWATLLNVDESITKRIIAKNKRTNMEGKHRHSF